MICWDARTLQRAFGIALNSWPPRFRADGRALGVETRTSVQLYSFEQPSGFREFAENIGPRLRFAAFSPDGRWLAASTDKRAGVWDLARGGLGAFRDDAYVTHFYFTPDGRELFGSRNKDGDYERFRWRIAPATKDGGPPQLERLSLHKPAGFAFLSLRSNSVVMASTNGTQLLAPEEVETGKEDWTRSYPGFNGVSRDGRWLGIFRPYTPSLYIHRLPGLERIAKLTHPANIGFFEFPPLSEEVALQSGKGVGLWRTTTSGALLRHGCLLRRAVLPCLGGLIALSPVERSPVRQRTQSWISARSLMPMDARQVPPACPLKLRANPVMKHWTLILSAARPLPPLAFVAGVVVDAPANAAFFQLEPRYRVL